MTIIEYMRQKLTEYPKISEFLTGDDIHIDFTEPDPVNYGLSSNGDSLVKEDILGNQIRRHNFVGTVLYRLQPAGKQQFPFGTGLLARAASRREWNRSKCG